MKKTANSTKILVALLCALLLVSSLGFGRSNPAAKYEDAIELLQAGKYSEAVPAFKELGHYQDAGEYAMYASALAEAEKENYTLAASTMAALGDFMDSSLMAVYFTGRSYESRQRYEEADSIYQTILLYKDVQERVAALPALILQRDYAAADSLEKRGDQAADNADKRSFYVKAKSAFEALGSYSDSAARVTQLTEKINAIDYAAADALEKQGDGTEDSSGKRSLYVWAKADFTKLGSYSDSAARVTQLLEKINAVDYAAADALEKQGKLENAYDAFIALGSYSDSTARAEAILETIHANAYAAADALEKQGKLENAYDAFIALGSYSDSAARAEAVRLAILKRDYEAARALEDADDILGAYDAYLALKDYEDAAERAAALLPEVNYRKAFMAAENGEYTKARNAYLALKDYKDAAEKARLLGIPAISQDVKRVAAGVYSFYRGSLWGLINLNENLDLRPAWSSVARFNKNGLAVAGSGSGYGLINLQGETVLPLIYYDLESNSDGYFAAAYRKSSWTYTHSLIAPDGQVLTSGWDALGLSSGKYAYAPNFTGDTIIAQNDKGYCLLHKDGTVLLEKQRALNYLQLSTGEYTVMAQGNDKLWRFHNLDGSFLTADAWKEVGSFTAGYAPVKSQDGLWGFIRESDCQVAIAPAYYEVYAFSEGYAAVRAANKHWGFINTQGEMVIDARYEAVNSFSGGMSTVTNPLLGSHIIDKNGELVYFKETVYDLAADYDANKQYESAIEAFESLNSYADSADRALQARDKINQQIYARAEESLRQGNLPEAAETFEWLGAYSDAAKRAADIRETISANTYASAEALEAEGQLEKAIAIYLTLGDYRGAAQHAADLREGINQSIVAEAEAFAEVMNYEEAIATLSQIPDYQGVSQRIAEFEAAIPARDYQAAAAMEDAGQFEEAIAAFTALNGYSDTSARIDTLREKIRQREYNAAAAMEDAGQFEEAIAAFAALNGYSDTAARIDTLREKIRQRDYNAAAAMEDAGRFEEAIAAFAALNGYSDTAARIDTLHEKIRQRDYQAACDQEALGEYALAYQMFTALGEYSDSQARAQAVTEKAVEQQRQNAYNNALALKEAGKLNESLEAFKALGNYSNSLDHVMLLEETIRANSYNEAVQLLADEKYSDALNAFRKLGSYSDSAAKMKEAQKGIDYQAAFKLALNGKFKEASLAFSKLGNFKDSQQKAAVTGTLSTSANTTNKIADGVFTYKGSWNLWGIANLNTNKISEAKYNSINTYQSQASRFKLLQVYISADSKETNGHTKYGYIDYNGREIVPCKYYGVSDFSTDGFCTVVTRSTSTTRSTWSSTTKHSFYFGIITREGQTITSANWRTLGTSKNSNWGKTGNSNKATCNVPSFTNGFITVQTKDGTWGFINKAGKVIGGTQWVSVQPFSDGMAVVKNSGYKYTFINEQGTVIGSNTWQAINSFSNGMAAVQQNDKWGFINKKNELVIPCRYKQVNAFKQDGTCEVQTASGTWIIIDKQGNSAFFGN